MTIRYGYTRDEIGMITINQEQAATVNLIYDLYLEGKSLGGIADELKEQGIPSPTGKPTWTRAAIDNILSNGRYVPWVISENQFWQVQIEKERRSNTNADSRTRKAARYNSQNVLSGLLICGDCGRKFRRITRPSGEVVWRCADKVENGRRAACSNSIAIKDEEIKGIICAQMGLATFDEEAVREEIVAIEIAENEIEIQMKSSMEFNGMAL